MNLAFSRVEFAVTGMVSDVGRLVGESSAGVACSTSDLLTHWYLLVRSESNSQEVDSCSWLPAATSQGVHCAANSFCALTCRCFHQHGRDGQAVASSFTEGIQHVCSGIPSLVLSARPCAQQAVCSRACSMDMARRVFICLQCEDVCAWFSFDELSSSDLLRLRSDLVDTEQVSPSMDRDLPLSRLIDDHNAMLDHVGFARCFVLLDQLDGPDTARPPGAYRLAENSRWLSCLCFQSPMRWRQTCMASLCIAELRRTASRAGFPGHSK